VGPFFILPSPFGSLPSRLVAGLLGHFVEGHARCGF